MKKQQRKEFAEKRNLLDLSQIMHKSLKIKEKFFSLNETRKAKNIMIYISFKSEARTREIILELLEKKKKVIVPVINFKKNEISLSELKDYQKELVSSKLGLFQPAKEFFRPFNPKELDLIVVPGIAFDEKGNRLGFGKGYYDKFLSKIQKKIPVIALAFEEQIGEKIVSEKHDIKMHKIITEK
ncbi:5-formyltetrahydrofolate cyclo-ligase, partial [Candidatus Micrarchaeota archaeon]|nr:5-formyltetrahydrofolate cyclo-ligase [Candidatus Micrarchaeota archaeon]